jgi:hypothetical protein
VLALAGLLLAAGSGARARESAASGAAALGATEAELRARFGEALRTLEVERALTAHETIVAMREPKRPSLDDEPAQPFAGQLRLARWVREGDVRAIEYDLFQGRVYRMRWRMAERFERPLMTHLIAHLRERLGEPAYDQTLKAKLGSPRAELRRAGWRRGTRALEIRQLHPLGGGPLFVTLSDAKAMQGIVDAGAVVMPQPETSEEWWRRPQRPSSIPTRAERETLLAVVDALLAPIGF